jgi:secernin
MCDTMIAMGTITGTGRTCLAKTSGREPNEAQYFTRIPAADHPEGAMVRMTFVEIPRVAHTSAHVGSRPSRMWGFEHGVNEHGLAIGNGAEWSRLSAGTEAGLQADRLPPRGGDPRAPNLKEVAATAPATAVKEPA